MTRVYFYTPSVPRDRRSVVLSGCASIWFLGLGLILAEGMEVPAAYGSQPESFAALVALIQDLVHSSAPYFSLLPTGEDEDPWAHRRTWEICNLSFR